MTRPREESGGPDDRLLIDRDDGVIVVTLNRPARRNALDTRTMLELREAVADASADESCVGLVLTGQPPAFSAGGDLSELPADVLPTTIADRHGLFLDAARALYELELPTVAVVNGPAVGAGCSLALMCDRVILAPSANLKLGFIDVGLPPDLLCTSVVERRAGWTVACDLFYTGRNVHPEEAVSLGLADEIVAVDQQINVALEWTRHIADRSLFAFRITKKMLRSPATNQELRSWEPLAVALSASTREFQRTAEQFRSRTQASEKPNSDAN